MKLRTKTAGLDKNTSRHVLTSSLVRHVTPIKSFIVQCGTEAGSAFQLNQQQTVDLLVVANQKLAAERNMTRNVTSMLIILHSCHSHVCCFFYVHQHAFFLISWYIWWFSSLFWAFLLQTADSHFWSHLMIRPHTVTKSFLQTHL